MRFLLFYDNLIRDYRGLLLLKALLEKKGAQVYLRPLWHRATEAIDYLIPDTVVMGQVGEYSTSLIGLHCHRQGVNLAINSTENVYTFDKLEVFFKVNYKEFNSDIIDLQVVASKDLEQFVLTTPGITHKNKYKHLGFPRLDLSVFEPLRLAEVDYLKNKYRLARYAKTYLFISSFIYDEEGGQVDQQNYADLSPTAELARERRLKAAYSDIFKKLIADIVSPDSVLLLKKHPWDKSDYLQTEFGGQNCIILEEDDYVAPLIQLSDYIIHTQSTAAIEAWIQGKPTIAILPDFTGDRSALYNHMQHEVIVTNYDELKTTLANYPVPGPFKSGLKAYTRSLDGKSTARLADALIKIGPRKIKVGLWKFIWRYPQKLYRLAKTARVFILRYGKRDSRNYNHHFKRWEKKKPLINALYREPIKTYLTHLDND